MKAAATILVVAALGLAGCVSEEPVESAADAEECAGSATASGGGASASATCDGASATANGESASATTSGTSGSASASATSTGATITLVPFTAEGNTYNGVFACAAVTCQGSDLPTSGSGETWFEPKLDGKLVGADLTLTWTAATPLTEELLLGIAYEKDDGEMDWIVATGPSPLVLSESGLDLPAETVKFVYVNPYKCQGGPVPVIACYGVEQAFTIEGTLATVIPGSVSASADTQS